MPTVLFVLFLLFVVVTLVGHAFWVTCAAVFRALGILSPRQSAVQPPSRRREQDDHQGFQRIVYRLWHTGHLTEEERDRLIRLGAERATVRGGMATTDAGIATQTSSGQRPAASREIEAPAPVAPPTADAVAFGRPARETEEEIFEAEAVPPPARELEEQPAVPADTVHPLDRPDVLEPDAPAGPRLQTRSRRALGDVVAAFLNKHNIRWGELVAGLLIVVCSIGLVVSLWSTLQQTSRLIPALILMAGTAAIEAAGLYTLRRWRLRATSRSVLVIASLLVPLNVVAAISLAAPDGVLLASPDLLSVAVMVLCAGVYTVLMWLAGRELLGQDAWRWTLAIVAPSAALLFVPLAIHHLGSTAGLLLIVPVVAVVVSLGLGTRLVPHPVGLPRDTLGGEGERTRGVAPRPAFLVSLQSLIEPRMSFRRFATVGQVRRFLLHWAIVIFAIAVFTAFTTAQAGLSRELLAWLSIAGIPLFTLAAADADRLRQHPVARQRVWIGITGRAVTLLCSLGIVASLIAAWPSPATALVWASVVTLATGILVARQQGVMAKHAIFAAVSVAALCGIPQLFDPQPWFGSVSLAQRLLGPLPVAVIGGLVAAFATIAAVSKERPAAIARRDDASGMLRSAAADSPAMLWSAGAAAFWTLLTAVVLLHSGPAMSFAWFAALLGMLIVQAIALAAASSRRPAIFHLAGALVVIGWTVASRGDATWMDVVEGDLLSFVSNLALCVLASIAVVAAVLRLVLADPRHRTTAQWLVALCGVLVALAFLWIPTSLGWAALLSFIAAATLYGAGRVDRISSLVEVGFVVGFASLVLFAQHRLWIDLAAREAWLSGTVVWKLSVLSSLYALLWFAAGGAEHVARRRRLGGGFYPVCLRVLSRGAGALLTVAAAWIYVAATPHAAWVFSGGEFGAASIAGRPPLDVGTAAAALAFFVALAEWMVVRSTDRLSPSQQERPARRVELMSVLISGSAGLAMIAAAPWSAPLAAAAVSLSVALLVIAIAGFSAYRPRVAAVFDAKLSQIATFAALVVGGGTLALVFTSGVLTPFLAGRFAALPFTAAIGLLAGLITLCVVAEIVHGWSQFRHASRALVIMLVVVLNFGWQIGTTGGLPIEVALLEGIASATVSCWVLLFVESCCAALSQPKATANDGRKADEESIAPREYSPALPPHFLGLPWRSEWNRRASLWTTAVALSIAISIAASAYLFAVLLANVTAPPRFVSAAVVSAVIGAVLALGFVLVRASHSRLDASAERQSALERRILWVLRRPWTAGSVVLIAGPVAVWSLEGTGGLPFVGWWVWALMMLCSAWLATLPVVLPRLFQSRHGFHSQEWFAWVLTGTLAAAAAVGVSASLAWGGTVCLLASATVLSFLLAYLRADAVAASAQAMTAALVSAAAVFLSWWELDLATGMRFPAGICQLGMLVASGVGTHALLWRGRALAVRPRDISMGLRVDAVFAIVATSLGLTALALFTVAGGSASELWFEGPLVKTAWLLAAVLAAIAASSLLRCEIPGQTSAGVLGAGALLGSVGYEACERFGNLDGSLASSATALAVGLFAILVTWEFDPLMQLRRKVPSLGVVEPAVARRQAAREATVIFAVVAACVAVLTFGHLLTSAGPESSWVWIAAFFAWAVAVAALAGTDEAPGVRTYSVLLLLAAVYAAALTNLPAEDNSKLLAVAIRVLVSSVALLPIVVLLVPRVFALSQRWTNPLLRGATAVAALLSAATVVMLGVELSVRSADGIPLLPAAWVLFPAIALSLVAAALLGIAIGGRLPGVEWLQLPVRDRQGCVYAAQVVGLITWWHIYLCRPDWAVLGLQEAWPWACVAIAFAATGLAHLAARRGDAVLAGPLRTNALIIPVVGIWMSAAGVQGAWPLESLPKASLLAIITVHYLVLAALDRRRRVPQVLGIIAGNAAVWVWLASVPGWGLLQHPQLWIIPPAACVLWAIQIDRDRLPDSAVATLRYSLTLIIYISSTADMLLQEVGSSLAGPIILAMLALAGMALGIALRIRPFLYLGAAFLFLALLSMVWHAQVTIDQVWPWWAFGISMGVLLLAALMFLERNRPAVKRLAARLQAWDG